MTWVTCLATAVACAGHGQAPELTGLGDQVAQVGTELKIDLNGTDPEGDHLTYGYHAADLTDLATNVELTASPSGAGVFRWTPLAADVGKHPFDFTVSDGSNTTTVTITIDVRSAIGSATAPVFIQPLGTGTTIDLSVKQCLDLDIVVDDQDSPSVAITQDEPVIEGAALTPTVDRTAKWHWCPTRDQQAETRYTLVLGANDGDNPETIKNYLIVLRGTAGGNCPGTAPVIMHTPADASTILDLTIDATISDDLGLKDAPLFYYSLTPPANPPDLSQMTQLSTLLVTGDNLNGQWAADVPNPVATMPSGTQQTIYYLFVADDNDDTTGTCDHTTTSPVYQMTVTSTASANVPACGTCTADAQCGAGNECVYMGVMGASYCIESCAGGCAAGTTCSSTAIASIDGASAVQCVPASGSCEAVTTTCQDDSWESNDSRSEASANPVLTPNTYDLVSCPSTTNDTRANDDWFKIVVTQDSQVDLTLAGGTESDLDLHLYHSDGTVISASTGLTADESLSECLPAGTYYVKVNGYGSARNEYTLDYAVTAQSCATTCVDDANEDDDNATEARETTYPSYLSSDNMTCPNDDDWYHVPLFTGDVMTVDLTFTEANSSQDLDLHLYRDGVDLTPCDVNNPDACSIENGQGASSNEHTQFTAPSDCGSGCDYYVVVRGYNGSSNSYAIDIEIQ